MQVTRLACLVVASALLGCGGGGGGDDDGGTTGPPPPPPGTTQTLGSITTSVTSVNLVAGNTQTIGVQALDTQGALIANAPSATFASANATIAEVDNQGAVLGLSLGSTTVNVSLTMGSVTRTATVAANVTGTLSNQADVVASSSDYSFSPRTVAIQAGGSVNWTFGGGVPGHTVTFASTAGAPASISESYSTSASRTFARAGNFTYICQTHAGMSGQIIVR